MVILLYDRSRRVVLQAFGKDPRRAPGPRNLSPAENFNVKQDQASRPLLQLYSFALALRYPNRPFGIAALSAWLSTLIEKSLGYRRLVN
jgi:hypothetical protein